MYYQADTNVADTVTPSILPGGRDRGQTGDGGAGLLFLLDLVEPLPLIQDVP